MSFELPIILHKNVFDLGTLTVTTEEPGFPKENILDLRLNTVFSPTGNGTLQIDVTGVPSQLVDTLVIGGHDLNTRGATVEVFRDTGTPVSLGSITPTNDDQFLLKLTAGTDTSFRIEITGLTGVPVIGIIMLGKRIVFPRTPVQGFNFDDVTGFGETFVSETGQFLGSANQFLQRNVLATWDFLPDAFINDDLLPFLYNHYLLGKPFFWILQFDPSNNRVFHVWPPKNPKINMRYLVNERDFELIARGALQSNFEVGN